MFPLNDGNKLENEKGFGSYQLYPILIMPP